MRRQVTGILAIAAALGLMLAASAAPSQARTAGREAIKGVIVSSGESGTRTVVGNLLVVGGVVDKVGRSVEVKSRPGDADDVSRHDLVFGQGRIHIVSLDGAASTSLNPQTCTLKRRVKQTVKIRGGTGIFAGASGRLAGALRVRLVYAHRADGSCAQDQAPLLETEVVLARGHISI